MSNPFLEEQSSDNPFMQIKGAADLNQQELNVVTRTNSPTEETPDSFGLVDYPKELGKGAAQYLFSVPRWIGGQTKKAGELAAGFEGQDAISTFKKSFLSRIALDTINGDAPPSVIDNIGNFLGAEKDVLVNLLSEQIPNFPERLTNAGNALIEDNKNTLEAMGLVPKGGGNFMFSAGQGFGSLVLSVGLTVLTKKPAIAATLMGAIVDSEDYLEARNANKQPAEAAQIAFASALPQAMVETIGGKYLLAAAANSTRFATIVKRTLGQGLEEGVQSIIEETVKAATEVRTTSLWEKFKNVFTNFTIGIVVGGPVSAAVTLLEKKAPPELNLTPEKIDNMVTSVLENKDTIIDELTFLLDKERSKVADDPNLTADAITEASAVMAQVSKVEEAEKKGKTTDPEIAAMLMLRDKSIPLETRLQIKALPEVTMESLQGLLDKRQEEIVNEIFAEQQKEDKRALKVATKEIYTRVPKEPQRFISFIIKRGGIKWADAEILKLIDGSHKRRPGLISSKGKTLDEIGEIAREAGFFSERPTTADVLNMIREDYTGLPQYSMDSTFEVEVIESAKQYNEEVDLYIDRFDIDIRGKTRAEFWDEVYSRIAQEDMRAEIQALETKANKLYDDAIAAEDEWRATRKDALGDVPISRKREDITLEELENEWAAEQKANANSLLSIKGDGKRQGVADRNNAQIQGGGGGDGGGPKPPIITDDRRLADYAEIYGAAKRKNKISGKIKDNIEDLNRMVGSALVPISTRLKNISPSLKNKLRKFEFDLANAVNKDARALEPFLKKWKALPGDIQLLLDYALKNGDTRVTKIIADKYQMSEELEQVRSMLDNIYKRAANVGLEIGYLGDYFPRHIEKPQQLLDYFNRNYSEIGKALRNKQVELGRILTAEEQAYFINTIIRGYGKAQLALSGPGNVKERGIDTITPEINEFYSTTDQALLRYATTMNDAIESRRFFGKEHVAAGGRLESTLEMELEDSIGHFVMRELLYGTITPAQQDELTSILRARFKQGKMSSFWRVYKNFSYIDTMGSFVSAVTQLGDLAFSMYKNGVYNTLGAFTKATIGRSEVSMADINIDKIAQEFSESSTSASAVNLIFKLSGIATFDRIGKETFINSSLQRFRALAKKPTKEFLAMMENILGSETEQTIQDLKDGRIASENVKLLLFNDILDVQPVALSEMPETYLRAGNGRIFYMLKTFTIKQFDVYRNEVFSQIRKEPVKGLKNLLRLVSFFILMNAGADFLKDLILNRETPIEDHVVNNIARLFGLSKYQIYTSRKEGVGTAAFKTIAPPFKAIDSLYKDMAKAIESGEVDVNDLKSVQSVPIVGKFYYWWFGAGAEKKTTSRKY
jgi:hypothetical protein